MLIHVYLVTRRLFRGKEISISKVYTFHQSFSLIEVVIFFFRKPKKTVTMAIRLTVFFLYIPQNQAQASDQF